MEREEIQESVSLLLDQNFREWMDKTGKVKTRKELAQYLDVDYTLLTRWLAGTALPGNDNVIKIANKFGPEIYDLLGWVRPN